MARLARSVIAYPPIRTLDPPVLLRSLEVYETHRVDFAEAYLVASAEAAGIHQVASFDRTIDRVPTITRILNKTRARRSDGLSTLRPCRSRTG